MKQFLPTTNWDQQTTAGQGRETSQTRARSILRKFPTRCDHRTSGPAFRHCCSMSIYNQSQTSTGRPQHGVSYKKKLKIHTANTVQLWLWRRLPFSCTRSVQLQYVRSVEGTAFNLYIKHRLLYGTTRPDMMEHSCAGGERVLPVEGG